MSIELLLQLLDGAESDRLCRFMDGHFNPYGIVVPGFQFPQHKMGCPFLGKKILGKSLNKHCSETCFSLLSVNSAPVGIVCITSRSGVSLLIRREELLFKIIIITIRDVIVRLKLNQIVKHVTVFKIYF